MSLAGQIKMGGAYIPIGADLSGLESKLQSVKGKFSSLGSGLLKIGGVFSVAGLGLLTPLGKSLSIFQNYGDQIAKAGKRTWITAQSMGELSYVAELEGAGLESLEKGIRRMQRSLTDYKDNLSTTKRVYQGLGIGLEEIINLSPEEQFYKLAGAMGKMKNASLQAAYAQQIFGRGGPALIPMINSGTESIRAMRKEYQEFYGTLNFADAEALNDNISRVKHALRGIAMTIGQILSPAALEITSRITGILVALRKVIAEHPEIIKALGKIGIALLSLGTIFTATGITILAIMSSIIGTTLVITGCIAAIVLAVLSLLETFGILDLGINQSLKSIWDGFTIFGRTISDWFQTLKNNISIMFYGWVNIISEVYIKIYEIIMLVLKKIADGWAWIISLADKAAGAQIKAANEMAFSGAPPKFLEEIRKWSQGKMYEKFQTHDDFVGSLEEKNKGKPSLEGFIKKLGDILKSKFPNLGDLKDIQPELGGLPEQKLSKGVSGFFGLPFAEMLGVSSNMDKQQLDELKKISFLLENIESQKTMAAYS
jgi:hypothetical protein